MSVISNIHQIGDEADLPTLTVYHDGYTYFAEDTGKYYRWNGSSLDWDLIADSSSVAANFIKKDGSVAFTGDQSMGTNQLTNVGDPGSAQDAATKSYVDGIAANLGKRARVRVATTANITIATGLNNGDSLDGVTLVTGDLVLVKDQTAAAENGVYTVGVSPARTDEFNTYDEHPGSLIAVQEGTANEDTIWLCTSNVGGVLGTNDIDFSRLGTGGTIEALTTSETDTDLVLAPDGAGGVEWVLGGGGGVTPPTQVDATDITGCTTWIDASQEAFSDGDAVGTASDFSAANNDATQGTAGNKPTFRTNVFNGKPAFYFGGDDFLVFGSNITHSTPTVIMVCNRYIRAGATYMTLLSIQKFGIYSRLNTALCFGVFNNGERIHGADLNFEPVILTVKYNTASNLSIYVNGQMVSASGGSDGTATTSRIGWDGSASQYHQGFISELRIYDNIISEADRLASEEWLGYNWRVPGYQGA